MSSSACRSRGCGQPAVGLGPQSGFNLCQNHLEKEVKKVKEQQEKLIQRLRSLGNRKDRQSLRAEQSALEAEMQQVSDMFDTLQEKAQQWRDRVISRVQAAHDSVAGILRDAVEAEECEKEVSRAADAGDIKKVMEVAAEVESWLDEAGGRSDEFDRVRSMLRDRQIGQISDHGRDANVRSVGDVSAGVQSLQFVIDKHMSDVMKQCWIGDEVERDGSEPVCQFVRTVEDLGNEPCLVTHCSNMTGFVGDASGQIVRKNLQENLETGPSCVPLPKPSIFISFAENCANYLLVTSLDGAVRLKCYSESFDWSQWISGLHCDSRRQLLYVAQYLSVTVMDLSGSVSRVINEGSLGQSLQRIAAITGNSDKLFLLDRELQKIVGVSKESGQVETVISVSAIDSGELNEIALHGSKLLVVDFKSRKVHRVCSISGQLIVPPASQHSHEFQNPCFVAVDSRGIMFVTEPHRHTVLALSGSGILLQTLGIPDLAGSDEKLFNFPHTASILEEETGPMLAVADKKNGRMCLYRIV